MRVRAPKSTEAVPRCILPPKLCFMESTFSSPAEAALQREAGDPGLPTPVADLDRVYELERVIGFVRNVGCQRVRADVERADLPFWRWVAKSIGILGIS